MESAEVVKKFRKMITGRDTHWVLFASGTCVTFTGKWNPAGVRNAAAHELREHGAPGPDRKLALHRVPPHGNVVKVRPNVMTYVPDNEATGDAQILALGAQRLDADHDQLQVVHVEQPHGLRH